jgi:branched-chain amino acid transport system ATP-binding protein
LKKGEDPRLLVTDIAGGYGDLKVLWGVALTARSGEVTAVLGRNGAGKSSLLKAIAGLLPAFEGGSIVMDGREITRLAPYHRTRRGLGFVQEGKRIFRRRTVEENLLIGGYTLKRPVIGMGKRCARLWTGRTHGFQYWPSGASPSPADSRAGSSRCSPWPRP